MKSPAEAGIGVQLKKVILCAFSALISVGAWGLEPVIKLQTDGSNRPTVSGETNLPDGTALTVSIRIPGKYGGLNNATVVGRRFSAGPFTVDGGPLPPGEAVIDAQTAMPQMQPDSVRQVIGEYGENLSGPLVYTVPGLSGRMIKAITRATIN